MYAKSTGGYLRDSTYAQANANEIAQILHNNGWTKNAICALLGNGAGESGLNPWRWEGDYIPTISEFQNWTIDQARQHGYGIFQFTPANKYINSTNSQNYASYGYAPNFSDSPGLASDGVAQTMYFKDAVPSDWSHQLYNYYYDNFIDIGVDISSWYYTTYQNFILGLDNYGANLTLAELTGVFELCYERPGDTYAASSYYSRVDNATYWYNHINIGPTPWVQRKLPWIYYVKRRKRYGDKNY